MRYVAIIHVGTHTYHSNYEGSLQNCVSTFERWCKKYDVIWATLMEEKAGLVVAYYNNAAGCNIIT